MRFLAAIFCMCAAVPSPASSNPREDREAEWIAALAGAATSPQDSPDELPQPLQEALRLWSDETGLDADPVKGA